jgi:hypothetical protein
MLVEIKLILFSERSSLLGDHDTPDRTGAMTQIKREIAITKEICG